MGMRVVSVAVAAVLLGGVVAATGLGEVWAVAAEIADQRALDELRGRTRSDDGPPDVRESKSLTPEERRKRTMRRKLRRVDELIEAGEYAEGAALLESLGVGGSPHADSALAFSYSQSNQPEKAMRYYERVLKTPEVPESVELLALRQLARLYHARGRDQLWDEDAEEWFGRALSSMQTWIRKSSSPDPDAYLFVARIHLELKDLDAGIASLEAAIETAEEQGAPVKEELSTLLERLKPTNED